MEAIISLKDVCKEYTRNSKVTTEALQDISFDVFKGETLGIVGESGSGKSTLAQILAGLLDASKGTVKRKGSIQMVFQNPVESFNPRRTLEYSVGEYLKNKGIDKKDIQKKVAKTFTLCGLKPELANKYPHQVSGGQCQRAAIARALIAEPDILICDEATSSLDVTVQKQIIDLLDELKDNEGLTIIFISHDLSLVEMFCERAIIIKAGRLCKIYEKKTNYIG